MAPEEAAAAAEEGRLARQLHGMMVSHLHDLNLLHAAAAVASATLHPHDAARHPPFRLLRLLARGLAAEEAALRCSSEPTHQALQFSTSGMQGGSSSKSFPKHDCRHISDHKNVARCARFSPDGKFVATGSSDTSIKLFEVAKIKQMMVGDAKDGAFRPVIRTFYDHPQPINDLDFSPNGAILISGAKDNTIKFFDLTKAVARRAFRVIQDTHNVRSVCFHPSGEYLLAGTDHSIPHLYDINTFRCFLSANVQDINDTAAINQVRYSSTGSLYVTASKDGSVRIWDGVSAQCIRPIVGAHGFSESTSAQFTKDERYVLSCGKDSLIKLWEVSTGKLVRQYSGAVHKQIRCQAVFNETEDFVLSVDELGNEVVVWDTLVGERAASWPSNHAGAPRWLAHSPTEPSFVTCGNDKAVQFWKGNA